MMQPRSRTVHTTDSAAWSGKLHMGYVHKRARGATATGATQRGDWDAGVAVAPPHSAHCQVPPRGILAHPGPARPAPARKPRPHPPSPAQGSSAPQHPGPAPGSSSITAQVPLQAQVSPPRLRPWPWRPWRTQGKRLGQGGPNPQHGGGRQLTMITEGMLTGKEVTEKADGIVPVKACPAHRRPANPTGYRQPGLRRRLSRDLLCREICVGGSGRVTLRTLTECSSRGISGGKMNRGTSWSLSASRAVTGSLPTGRPGRGPP